MRSRDRWPGWSPGGALTARGAIGKVRRHVQRGSVRVVGFVFVAAAVLASCTSGARTGSTTNASQGGTGSNVPLVPPVSVLGTSDTGSLGFLGSVLRLTVIAIPPGASEAPADGPGTPGFQHRVAIAFRSFGTGPPLLLLSGQDGSLTWWSSGLLSSLAAHFHVVVVDYPGVGYSGPATERVTIALWSDEMAGLLHAMGLTKVNVVGWGIGGQVALGLAERHRSLVGRLVLADAFTGGPGSTPPSPAVEHLLSTPGTTPTALAQAMFPQSVTGGDGASTWREGLFLGTPDWLTAQAVTTEARLVASAWKTAPVQIGLGSIDQPALLVTGADDLVVPPANTALIATRLKSSRTLVLPGAGYGAIVQDATSFVSALQTFVG